MSAVPEKILALLRERDGARATKDFAKADALRAEIDREGFLVRDTAQGSVAERKPRYDLLDPKAITNRLAEPATASFSFHVLYEGFPGDLERFLRGFTTHNQQTDVEVVVVDNASSDGEQVHDIAESYPSARVIHLNRAVGWAQARNAGLSTSAGRFVVLADLSIEPVGDICAPLAAAFADPAVGLAGPFGLVTDDMRDWHSAAGRRPHAIEGYLLAMRRELLQQGLIDERFDWYRNADIDLSFQLRAQGATAVVVDLPVEKHPHRGWEALEEAERGRRSKKNHGIVYERWRDRRDLLD